MRELASWFGYKNPDALTKKAETKQKKLKILEGYADYHWDNKKLYIDKIYVPIYVSAMEVAEAELEKEWGNIKNKNHELSWQKKEMVDTCTRVAKTIYKKHKEIQTQVTEKTFITYCIRVKVQGYGHNYLDDKGERGRCDAVYVNIAKDRMLTNEELEIIHQCKKEAYAGLSEKIANLDEAYYSGEITKKERDEQVGSIDTQKYYFKYIDLMAERLKYIPDKMTKLIPERYFE